MFSSFSNHISMLYVMGITVSLLAYGSHVSLVCKFWHPHIGCIFSFEMSMVIVCSC